MVTWLFKAIVIGWILQGNYPMLKALYRIGSWFVDPFCDAKLFFRASKPIWIFLTFRIQSFSNICFRAVQWFGWKRILTIVVQVEWNETKWRKIVRIFFLLMMIAEGSRLGWHKKAILFSPAVDLNHDDFCRNVLWLQSCAIVVVQVAERWTADPNDLGSNPAAAELLNWSSFTLKFSTNFGFEASERHPNFELCILRDLSCRFLTSCKYDLVVA